MLSTGEIIRIFAKSQKKDTFPDAELISNIMQHVSIDSGIKPNGVDYYIRINIFDLSKSGISDETIFEMSQNGWVLSKDRKYIEFFY